MIASIPLAFVFLASFGAWPQIGGGYCGERAGVAISCPTEVRAYAMMIIGGGGAAATLTAALMVARRGRQERTNTPR